ncbi:hypothetical protein BLOT_012799 [Blomia tropicalis]|nr:hypothetical protein BLOT_012799 [Blomia tropicalis]
MSTTTANDTTDTNNESKIDKSFTESASTAIKKECLTLDTQRPVVTSVAITPELIRRRQQRTRVNAEQLDPVGHFLIQEKSIKSLSSNFTSKATKQQEQQQYKQQNPDDETRGNSRSSEADNKNLFLALRQSVILFLWLWFYSNPTRNSFGNHKSSSSYCT